MPFLVYLLHKENCNSDVIALTRSALSAILTLKKKKTFAECQKVSKLLKGILKSWPTVPKYTVIYDSDIILNYMGKLPNNSSLLLEDLTRKLCTLLLLSGQRCQTIASLDLTFNDHSSEKFEFTINNENYKTGRTSTTS